eukprot:543667-Amphidinium_carterae.1
MFTLHIDESPEVWNMWANSQGQNSVLLVWGLMGHTGFKVAMGYQEIGGVQAFLQQGVALGDCRVNVGIHRAYHSHLSHKGHPQRPSARVAVTIYTARIHH